MRELLRMKEHHARSSGGGRLRAAVFGVNDGLVTNASLVVGVAAADPGRHVVILAGIAGLVAGAFSMAAGEFISMSVQRELFGNFLLEVAYVGNRGVKLYNNRQFNQLPDEFLALGNSLRKRRGRARRTRLE